MDELPTPRQVHAAARVANALAYVVGAAGVVAGAVAYRVDGDVGTAALVWVLTFAAGSLLVLVSLLARGVAGLMARTAAMEQDLRVLLGRTGPPGRSDDGPGPWSQDHPNPW